MSGSVTFDATLERQGEVTVTIEYSVSGAYRPATWGYWGGSPEEFPEVEIETVTLETEDGDEVEVDESEVTASEWKMFVERVNDDVNTSDDDGPEPEEMWDRDE